MVAINRTLVATRTYTKAMQITVNEWSAGIGLDKEVAEPSEQGESESITPDEAVDVSEGPEAKRRRCGNP